MISSKAFILPASIVGAISASFVLWQLGFFAKYVYSLPRPEPTIFDYLFAICLVILISMTTGLLSWQRRFGTCPIGTKRASSLASLLGVSALICPACVLLPFTIFGTSIALSVLSPFVPLLQIISIFLLIVSMLLLWPKQIETVTGK